ncbi:hypothetical protein [Mycobacterium riyadhense]|uniref:hypothetical protein n=1 Tax=Mycobacterium riyadhense TaxID=486698 RepID=UPI00195653D4|nr:hypothetical protein [Mycobacterium riyadhense]
MAYLSEDPVNLLAVANAYLEQFARAAMTNLQEALDIQRFAESSGPVGLPGGGDPRPPQYCPATGQRPAPRSGERRCDVARAGQNPDERFEHRRADFAVALAAQLQHTPAAGVSNLGAPGRQPE